MIRRAGPGDVNALRAIAAAAYHKYVPRIGRNPAPMTAGYAQPARNRQAPAANEDGEIAGFALLIARPGCLLPGNVARPARRPGPRDRRAVACPGRRPRPRPRSQQDTALHQ